MVYINSRGEIVDHEPITWKTPFKFLLRFIWFFINFFLTLFGMSDRSDSMKRYFLGSSGYSSGGGGGGGNDYPGGGGGGGVGGFGGRPRRIATLPRNSPIGMSTCPGGSCGR
ncbi:uncharacterized protein LOC124495559 [Dermatophagoides farinae]|uniref:Glycine-rich protein n=1 Tax=Dermatophagoides farinae TaxID=6954 RepID=A0A922I6M2_DERFA|nr:hypothetical protein DERF_000074 [Dermatophagoides farinae]